MTALILQLGLLLDNSAEQVDALLVDALRRQVGGLQLQRGPRFKDVVRASAEELKVESGRSRHRGRARGGDNQAATRAAAHPRHLVLLEQPDGLTEDRAPDAKLQHQPRL